MIDGRSFRHSGEALGLIKGGLSYLPPHSLSLPLPKFIVGRVALRYSPVVLPLMLQILPNFTSCNLHIWIFWTSSITVSVSQVCEQSITSNVSLADGSLRIVLSVIYAKCTRSERKVLWNNLCMISPSISVPWILGGDLNVISNAMEKAGGNYLDIGAIADFNAFQHFNALRGSVILVFKGVCLVYLV